MDVTRHDDSAVGLDANRIRMIAQRPHWDDHDPIPGKRRIERAVRVVPCNRHLAVAVDRRLTRDNDLPIRLDRDGADEAFAEPTAVVTRPPCPNDGSKVPLALQRNNANLGPVASVCVHPATTTLPSG
jgi:hypothetical protein